MLPFNSKNIHLRPAAIYELTSIRVISSVWQSTSPASEASGKNSIRKIVFIYLSILRAMVSLVFFSFILNPTIPPSNTISACSLWEFDGVLTQGGRREEEEKMMR